MKEAVLRKMAKTQDRVGPQEMVENFPILILTPTLAGGLFEVHEP